MSIKNRLNPVTGFVFGITLGGILGTFLERYFGAFLFGGAVLGLLVGQWCRNQRDQAKDSGEQDIEWIPRE